MNERSLQVWVGLMMLAALIALCVLAVMFGTLPKWIGGGEYTVTVTFEQAPGVSPGTPVRKSGILVGRVTDVQFAPDGASVEVTAKIQKRWKLYRNELCRVQTSLLGDAVVEFVRASAGQPPGEPIRDGQHIAGIYLSDPNQMVANLQSDFKTTVTSVNRTSGKLYDASENLAHILRDNREGIRETVNRTNALLADTQKIIGDEANRKNLQEAISELPKMIQETSATVKLLKETVQSVQDNMKDISVFTGSLRTDGPSLVSNLNRATSRIDLLVGEMLKLSQSMNSSEGTVGQLINNPELYQRMVRAARNLDDVSRQLRPILDDARVFSDKIARHPELLGVKGAVKGSVGIK
jgi:phospholipid/cholesterol/gamma-HCH transport system substrate-binding protein